MPFEGALLGVGLTQAIAAIPGAINNVRDILSRKQSDNIDALEEVDRLCDYIIEFGNTAGWLEEIKRLHEHLQRLDETLEDARRQYRQATATGRFISQDYRLAKVRETWEVVKNGDLGALIAFSQQIKRIDNDPLVVGSNNRIISGPEWACRFLKIKSQIDESFSFYDSGDDTVVVKIADYLNQLSSIVKNYMFLADERIRNEAIEFGRELAMLAGSLKNVKTQ